MVLVVIIEHVCVRIVGFDLGAVAEEDDAAAEVAEAARAVVVHQVHVEVLGAVVISMVDTGPAKFSCNTQYVRTTYSLKLFMYVWRGR